MMRGIFQKLLLLSTIAAVSMGASSAKKKAQSFFPKGSGALVNLSPAEFEDTMLDSDQLLFIFVYDSEDE